MNLSQQKTEQKTRYVTVTSNDHEVQTDIIEKESKNVQVQELEVYQSPRKEIQRK